MGQQSSFPAGGLVGRVVVQSISGVLIGALLLFGAAGALSWPQGWAFLLLFFVGGEASTVWLLRHDRALLVERMRSPLAAGQTGQDRAIMTVLLLFFLGWLVFMGLDARRFGWSQAPLWANLLGAGLIVAALWGWFEVLRANSFAATTVRIQADRGQRVIDRGPYAVVRHPLYAFTLLFMLGAPLMLGSLWGLAGLLVFVPLLGARALGEEALLMRELDGYASYARRVRFRLVPGIW